MHSLLTGYALPIPADLAASHPGWLGTGTAPAGLATPGPLSPAAPVLLPVPTGTEIDAVTAGTVTINTDGAVALLGQDGAAYAYAGVAGVAAPAIGTPGIAVKAGQRLGSAGTAGVTFAITVPDVAGFVCATSALQAWSEGINIDVRSLPQTCLPGGVPANPTLAAPAQPAAERVLIVTDAQAGTTGAELQGRFSGTQVTAQSLVIEDTQPAPALVAQLAAAQPTPADLVIVSLPGATADKASALLGLLPHTSHVLWVAPPEATGHLTGGPTYGAELATDPGLRVELLPSALAVLAGGPLVTPGTQIWSALLAKVTGATVVRYAASAYRLPMVSPEAAAVLAYAESQLGKPYVWAAAGPGSFDCSGLTMMAFRQVGDDFVHNAYAQYEATKQDAVTTGLQPGDLVFFGPNEAGIHHVGIYVADDEFIDAPDTGSVVRFDTLGPGWDYFGATRPLTAAPLPGSVSGSQASSLGLDDNQAFAQAFSDATWDPSQFGFLLQLWNRESGWDPTATNSTSGAFGIPQALPADKMATAGPDWATDPFTQILWGVGYIQARYGSPAAAWAHETTYGWY